MRQLVAVWIISLLFCGTAQAQDLAERYITEWKSFYPSKAQKAGMHSAIGDFEDFSAESIQQWLEYNKQTLNALSQDDADIDRIDARLLRVQAQSEIDLYEKLAEHQTSLTFYSQPMAKAIITVQQAEYLLGHEKSALYCERMTSMTHLAEAAMANLVDVPKSDLQSGLKDLSETQNLITDSTDNLASCIQQTDTALKSIQELVSHTSDRLKSAKDSETVLGAEEYNRRLRLYTDSNLTSEKLQAMAMAEITTVKKLMATVSKDYLLATYPEQSLPETELQTINKALADMEKDVPINGRDYLQFWQQLAKDSVDFIRANNIATLPEFDTLRIQNAPESAGPAARIGWVASAPPFHPNPVTTLNLPSIPETFPKQDQIDFWASFNKPFNRMIVIHELYPGHYMQLKISRETPHPIRLLFPYGTYIEGWATFTEKVLLDAGWQKEDRLTLLAHLRKRLENANRAYTSVQVHCNGWDKAQVMKFSTETSLVAPQFAKSLWGRIINSPLQLTSYFLGGAEFTELLVHEKLRLGNKFDLQFFMDTVMKAGPIPIDEFYALFQRAANSQ